MAVAIPACAPLGEQIQSILQFIKSPANRRPCSFVEVALGTGIPIIGRAYLLESLQYNPKVEVETRRQTIRYVSSIILDDVVDMLNIIAKSPRGLSAADLEDAYPGSEEDLAELVRTGKCIRVYSLDRQSGDKVFPRLGADPYEGVGMAARGEIDHRLVVPVGSTAAAKEGERTLKLYPGARIDDEIARGELIIVNGNPFRVSLDAIPMSRELKKAAESAMLAGDVAKAKMTIGRGMISEPALVEREMERGKVKDQPSLTVKETGGHFGATATGKHRLHQSWMYAHPHGGPDRTVTIDRPLQWSTEEQEQKRGFDEGMAKAWGAAHSGPGSAGRRGPRAGQKRARPNSDFPGSATGASGGAAPGPGAAMDVSLHRLGCSLDIRALWRQVQTNCSKLCRFQFPTDVMGMQRELYKLGARPSLSRGERVVVQRVAKFRKRGGGGSKGSVFDRNESRHLQGTAVGAELERAQKAVALRKQQEEEARWEEMQRGEEEAEAMEAARQGGLR